MDINTVEGWPSSRRVIIKLSRDFTVDLCLICRNLISIYLGFVCVSRNYEFINMYAYAWYSLCLQKEPSDQTAKKHLKVECIIINLCLYFVLDPLHILHRPDFSPMKHRYSPAPPRLSPRLFYLFYIELKSQKRDRPVNSI